MKKVCSNLITFCKKHYSLIFITLLFIACIVKEIFYVGMADSNYHFEFSFFYGLKQVGWKIIILFFTYAFLFGFSLFFNNIGRYIWAIVIYAVTLWFIVGDLAYTRFFQGPSSLFWKIMPHNSNNNVIMSFFVHYAKTDALWFVDSIVFFILFIIGLVKKLFNYNKFRLVSKCGTIITSLFLTSFLSLITMSKTINSLDSIDRVACYGNFIYHIIDIVELSDYNDLENFSDSLNNTYIEYENKIIEDENNSLDELNFGGIMQDSNLIILQLEGIESFVVGNGIYDSKGNFKEITPNINKLLNHSLQINAVEQVHYGNSSDCDLMLTTGQYPVSKVITFNQYENSKYISLPIVLNNLGYKTSYLNGAYGSTWNYTGVMDSTIGFNEAHFGDEILNHTDSSLKNDEEYNLIKVGGYINDFSILKYEEEILSKYSTGDKFYNHMVLCSSHLPYELPSVIDQAFLNNDSKLKKEIGLYFYNYITLANYVDYCIGRFISNLDSAGILENTSIVIVGDHGGIHKYMSNRTKNKLENNSKYVWTTKAENYTTLNIIYNKNIDGHYVIGDNSDAKYFNIEKYSPTKSYNLICGQIDVLPTLAYMYGIEDDFYYTNTKNQTIRTLMGRNVLKTKYSFALKSNFETVGNIPSEASVLSKGKYLSNYIIKSEYFGSKKNV